MALTQPSPSLEAHGAGTKQAPKRDCGILSFGASLENTALPSRQRLGPRSHPPPARSEASGWGGRWE